MTDVTKAIRLPVGSVVVTYSDQMVPTEAVALSMIDAWNNALLYLTVEDFRAIHDAFSEILTEAVPPEPTKTDPKKRAKLFALVTFIGLTPDERAEITELVLGEPHSWSDLTDTQATRLLDALEGWVHVNQLIGMRP